MLVEARPEPGSVFGPSSASGLQAGLVNWRFPFMGFVNLLSCPAVGRCEPSRAEALHGDEQLVVQVERLPPVAALES